MFFQDALSRSPAADQSNSNVEEDTIQQKMKHMIDLQAAYNGSFQVDERRKQTSQEQINSSSLRGETRELFRKENVGIGIDIGRNNNQQQSFRSIMSVDRPSVKTNMIHNQSPSTSVESEDSMVGKGKILFPKTYETSMLTLQSQYQAIDYPSSYNSRSITENINLYKDYAESAEAKHSHFCCLLNHFLKCIQHWWNLENLHRSFCYAAIDGMLTGAGLAGTLTGFGWSPSIFLASICAVACTADALCMALGHVWSTHVLSHQAATERRKERSAFEGNRLESKNRLIDLLLRRGMLKIDATSIADTLEGYPDIFIEALVGDDICSTKSPNNNQYELSRSHSNPDASRQLKHTTGYYSYGQFNELQHDPELASVMNAVGEAKKEGFVMFISFSVFGSIPSIFLFLAARLLENLEIAREGEANKDQTVTWVSTQSASLTVVCIIIWCLGVWKSRFLEPESWILFGVECVIVLLVCVLSAFWLGIGLSNVLLISM